MSLATARSWAAVHPTRESAALLLATGLVSAVLAQTHVAGLGPLRFVAPASFVLLLPAVAGTAVGLACAKQARLPLPDPARAKWARSAWVLTWLVLAMLLANLGQLTGADADGAAVARNVGLHASLALLAVTVGLSSYAWLPPVLLTLATMLFGAGTDADDRYWWAVLLEPSVAPGHLVGVGLIGAAVAGAYVWSGGWRTGAELD